MSIYKVKCPLRIQGLFYVPQKTLIELQILYPIESKFKTWLPRHNYILLNENKT